MTTCSKCGRPKVHHQRTHLPGEACWSGPEGDDCECVIAAAAYRRGIRDMLAVAKRTAWTRSTTGIDWTETEREAAKLAREAQ